jgi:hypothetical protein
VRAAGNRSGRRRMRSDTTLRPAYYPRGVVLVTAEEGPPGESTAARLWKIPFDENTVNLAALTRAQKCSEKLGLAMAGFVQFLASKLETDERWLHDVHQQAMLLGNNLGGHLRHPRVFAFLLTGWVVFSEFALRVGAVREEEVAERLTAVRDALTTLAARQEDEAREVRPELVFLETLGDLVAAGEAHLATLDGGAPEDAEAWGWRFVGSDSEDRCRVAHGTLVGWVDDDSLYLIPSVAQQLVTRTVAGRGGHFAPSPHALRETLHRGGFLREGNKDEGRRHNVWAQGKSRNVLFVDRGAVEEALKGRKS